MTKRKIYLEGKIRTTSKYLVAPLGEWKKPFLAVGSDRDG